MQEWQKSNSKLEQIIQGEEVNLYPIYQNYF